MNWRINAFLAALLVGVLFAIILIAHPAIQHSAVGDGDLSRWSASWLGLCCGMKFAFVLQQAIPWGESTDVTQRTLRC
jgi:hypothetical protein